MSLVESLAIAGARVELGVAEARAAADLTCAFTPAPASRNVRLFFGWPEALSNACWVMLTSPSSCVLGSWMPRTTSVRLSPEGIVMAIELPIARWWSLAYSLVTIAPSVPSLPSDCSEPLAHLNV